MADLLTSIRAEIDAHMRALAPLVAEYERLISAAAALDAEGRASAQPSAPRTRVGRKPGPARKPGPTARGRPRAPRGARGRRQPAHGPAGRAILAALEHGSHTLAELAVVTALPTSGIRDSLRQLRGRRAIVKTDRDGKAAYALPEPPV